MSLAGPPAIPQAPAEPTEGHDSTEPPEAKVVVGFDSCASAETVASAENRALAVALGMLDANEPLSIAEIARRANCSTRYLHKCEKLKAFIKSAKGTVPRGRKDRDTGHIEAMDMHDDDE